ncbi:MAG: ribosomal protein S18-alanine N-acetyltransferase [Brachymonas sp.]|nr:ribosomal protein S18-alanine N-acetyltransferase [Brachymonas sp.]
MTSESPRPSPPAMRHADAASGGAGGPAYHFAPAREADLDAILHVEQAAYPLPWSRESLRDILTRQGSQCGDYVVQLLWSQPVVGPAVLQGYFIALLGFEEMHLLNLAVHPAFQGQGCAVLFLQQLRHCACAYGARALWLEVRESNQRARALYQRFGFAEVSVRPNYYPTPSGGREHAVVMQLPLVG